MIITCIISITCLGACGLTFIFSYIHFLVKNKSNDPVSDCVKLISGRVTVLFFSAEDKPAVPEAEKKGMCLCFVSRVFKNTNRDLNRFSMGTYKPGSKDILFCRVIVLDIDKCIMGLSCIYYVSEREREIQVCVLSSNICFVINYRIE